MNTDTVTAFSQLALTEPLFKALDDVGYETPSPIQAQTIPLLLEGNDVLGEAQTGTGKTAAFALPILATLDLSLFQPQVLVLAPTRELAIQVAEAFHKYATHMKGFRVLPVYGGQDYRGQIRALQRGVHVVVGTPGRVMDHMRRGTLKLDGLSVLVLDEADEMLRMGFIEDVEWILEQSPPERQTALFSATMPQQVRRIAARHLRDPAQITIEVKATTAATIRQRFWPVSGVHKLDALTRILEAEPFDAMLIFVRTRTATAELSEKLEARGYVSAPLNGDIAQAQRERTVARLREGQLDIVVATDVAARGLDVGRISHVVNYDIPYDTEAYVHRIGRTGRAGRQGDAILFVAPREKRLLHAIEKATRQRIEAMELPSTELINDRRIAKFKQRITDALATEELGLFYQLVEQYEQEHNRPALEIAAALAQLLQGDRPFLLHDKPLERSKSVQRSVRDWSSDRAPRGKQRARGREHRSRVSPAPGKGMERYRIEVGHDNQVKPGNIVGAIANEANIDSRHIGRVNIYDDHSLVDLPQGMPKDIFKALKKVWVSGRQLRISRIAQQLEHVDSGWISGMAMPSEARVAKEKHPKKDKGPKKEKGPKEKSPKKEGRSTGHRKGQSKSDSKRHEKNQHKAEVRISKSGKEKS